MELQSDDREVAFGVTDGIASIVLNRPHVLNALSYDAAALLERAVAEVAANPSVRALVLTGAGRAFCVGGDINASPSDTSDGVARYPGDQGGDILDRLNRCARLLRQLPMPVICGINGASTGVGTSLALAADLRYAIDSARIGVGFALVGLAPDGGAAVALPRLIGQARALELLLSGRMVDAQEALAVGLVSGVFPAASFRSDLDDVVRRYADGPTVAYGAAKRVVYESHALTLEAGFDLEAQMARLAYDTEDRREGVRSFLEKRPPRFQGR